jgi:hypothetical protein
MAKVQSSTTAPAKHAPVAAAPAAKPEVTEKAKKVAEPVVEYITSAQLASTIGIKSTTLRRWLRTLPQFQDGGYTRYKWEPTDPFLKEAKERYEKFAASETEKQEKRLAEARVKAEKKAAAAEAGETVPKAKKSKKAPEPEVEEEVAEDGDAVLDDDEGEELE